MSELNSSLKPVWDFASQPYRYFAQTYRTDHGAGKRPDVPSKFMGAASLGSMVFAGAVLLGGSPILALGIYGLGCLATYNRAPNIVSTNDKTADLENPFANMLNTTQLKKDVQSRKEYSQLRKAWNFVAAPVTYLMDSRSLKKQGSTLDDNSNMSGLTAKIGLGLAALSAVAGAYPLAIGIYTMACTATYNREPEAKTQPKSPLTPY